ncbi:MAG: hypothetical protein J6W19_09105 [Prevotella sp.]|nr:hypothetical protein [Prevotella sp.]
MKKSSLAPHCSRGFAIPVLFTCGSKFFTLHSSLFTCGSKFFTLHSSFFTFLLLLATTASAGNDKSQSNGYAGAEIGIGTEGFRLGLGSAITPFLEVDLGVNYMPAITVSGNMYFKNATVTIPTEDGQSNTYNLNTVKVEGKFDRVTFDAKLYVYPFGSAASFFVVGGVSAGGGRLAWLNGHSDEAKRIYDENKDYFDSHAGEYEEMVEAVVGKTALTLAKNGNVAGEIRVPKVRPYVGAGFGRMVTPNGIGARLELGVEFTGKLKVYQGDMEIDYQDYLERANNNLAKLMDRMRVYPILKLTLTGRLF